MGATEPFKWARDKRRKLERYAAEPLRSYIERARDVALPGVPMAAIAGFFANNGIDENTTGWIAGDEAERLEALRKGRKPLGGNPNEGYGAIGSDDLDELGPGGVEGGHRPTPVATDPDCPWVELARSAQVNKILGRPGVEGKKWYGAHADQIAIGVANLPRHGHSVYKKLSEALRWVEDGDDAPKAWTLWPFFNAVSSWSAGSGGITRHLTRYANELAALPPAHRVGHFLKHAGAVDDPGNRHRQDEWTALRWAQKYEAMRASMGRFNEPWAAAWLDDGLTDAERPAVYGALVEACT